MDEGIWAVQDDIVDKRAYIERSTYRSSTCLLVVFFLLCTLLSFIAFLIVFLVHLVAVAFVGNCRLWF